MGHFWDPARFTLGTLSDVPVDPKENHAKPPFSFILLNQPLDNLELSISLFHKAWIQIFADGGANHFYDLGQKGDKRFNALPHGICGDLDSIRPNVAKHYKKEGVEFLKDIDQYSTDFEKCLKLLSKESEGQVANYNKNESAGPRAAAFDVVVLGGLGGRVDQAFAQFHQLYAATEDVNLELGDIYLVTPTNITFVLQKGTNLIRTPVAPGFFTENVGIIPLGKPSVITTKGLEWDVEDWPTEFGTQISTSNHIKADVVKVKTTEKVLFTIELADPKPPENAKKRTSLAQDTKDSKAPKRSRSSKSLEVRLPNPDKS